MLKCRVLSTFRGFCIEANIAHYISRASSCIYRHRVRTDFRPPSLATSAVRWQLSVYDIVSDLVGQIVRHTDWLTESHGDMAHDKTFRTIERSSQTDCFRWFHFALHTRRLCSRGIDSGWLVGSYVDVTSSA